MRKTYTFMFYFLVTLNLFGQGKVNVFLFVYDSKLTASDLNRKVNFIYLNNKKIKLTQFTVCHFSNKNESTATWGDKKKTVDYRPTYIDCNFSLCGTLNTLISISKTETNKFFNCNTPLPCENNKWKIEQTSLANNDESTILEKIEEEITINKNLKKNVTLFFYFSGEQSEINPTVMFEKDSIEMKSDATLALTPSYSKDVAKIEWKPAENLSCNDCKSPIISHPAKSTVYTITVTDSLKCKTTSKSLFVNVKSNCFCSNGALKSVSDVFGHKDVPKYSNDVDEHIADWQIASNQSGGYVFDFITTSNCASKFKVSIEDSNGKEVWGDSFTREQVDNRSNNDYQQFLCPECFVYRLNFAGNKKLTSNEQNYTINIYSYDDHDQECAPYKSPRVIFSKCN